MNVLKDRQTKSYGYISRYSQFPFYYNTVDNKYIYGLTSNLSEDTSYVLHEVSQRDTLDYLALKYYGRPDYFWIIANFNKIQDSFVTLWGNYKTIKVPSLSSIKFED